MRVWMAFFAVAALLASAGVASATPETAPAFAADLKKSLDHFDGKELDTIERCSVNSKNPIVDPRAAMPNTFGVSCHGATCEGGSTCDPKVSTCNQANATCTTQSTCVPPHSNTCDPEVNTCTSTCSTGSGHGSFDTCYSTNTCDGLETCTNQQTCHVMGCDTWDTSPTCNRSPLSCGGVTMCVGPTCDMPQCPGRQWRAPRNPKFKGAPLLGAVFALFGLLAVRRRRRTNVSA